MQSGYLNAVLDKLGQPPIEDNSDVIKVSSENGNLKFDDSKAGTAGVEYADF